MSLVHVLAFCCRRQQGVGRGVNVGIGVLEMPVVRAHSWWAQVGVNASVITEGLNVKKGGEGEEKGNVKNKLRLVRIGEKSS